MMSGTFLYLPIGLTCESYFTEFPDSNSNFDLQTYFPASKSKKYHFPKWKKGKEPLSTKRATN